MSNLAEAERRLLAAVGTGAVMSSARLVALVEQTAPHLSDDVVRSAYWGLVREGKLERLPTGVRRRTSPANEP